MDLNHPLSFVAFIGLGSLVLFVGVVIYLTALVFPRQACGVSHRRTVAFSACSPSFAAPLGADSMSHTSSILGNLLLAT